MPFKQKFTENQVLEAIKIHSDIVTADTLKEYIGCSLQTINTLLDKLMNEGLVTKSNIGPESHPVWLYKRTAKCIED